MDISTYFRQYMVDRLQLDSKFAYLIVLWTPGGNAFLRKIRSLGLRKINSKSSQSQKQPTKNDHTQHMLQYQIDISAKYRYFMSVITIFGYFLCGNKIVSNPALPLTATQSNQTHSIQFSSKLCQYFDIVIAPISAIAHSTYFTRAE